MSTTGEAVILDNKRITAPAAGETQGFSLDLSKGQQSQYKKQFQDKGSIQILFHNAPKNLLLCTRW